MRSRLKRLKRLAGRGWATEIQPGLLTVYPEPAPVDA